MSSVEFIFGLQLTFSILVWTMLAKWLVTDKLNKMPLQEVFFWLILPHAFRHIGMVFLVPGVVSESIPQSFASPTAYGDLISAMLALLALYLIKSRGIKPIKLIWIFNIFGTADLVLALSQPEAIPSLNAAWYIPTILVPLLLVTHIMIFNRLIRRSNVT